MSSIETKIFYGHVPALQHHIEDLARLRMTVFREWPYLYNGTVEFEQDYVSTYLKCPESIVVMLFDQDRAIGASTGIPMAAEVLETQKPFLEQGYDIERIFYCGESILLPEYRGRGLYKLFFQERERYARALGRFDWITFCGVQRPDSHPARPKDFSPLDPIWEKFGYRRNDSLVTPYSWVDLGNTEETQKPMLFWMKSLVDAETNDVSEGAAT